MKTNTPQHQSKARQMFEAAGQHVKMLMEQGRQAEALAACLQATRTFPGKPDVWTDAAVNCIQLNRWQDAVRYGQTALARGGNTLQLYDALAHAHGALKQWDEVQRYGLKALTLRDQRFGGEPPLPPPEPEPIPPLPSAQTRERNIIAFSLFGGDSKYCETAIFNALEQPRIYPDWVCRFYVDDSVPDHILHRLRKGGAQIVTVAGAAARWPGPMWRFLAINDPQAHRILFRDADSVISRREAGAVSQWIASGKRFHAMRDYHSHTELLLAGLWGMVGGSLPPLEQLMQQFLSAPLESIHFADQYFLRQYVWPYARTSLLQHDSIFGFMNGVPFPDGTLADDLHVFYVGYSEGSTAFAAKIDLPEGSKLHWKIIRIETPEDGGPPREELICAYPCTVSGGEIKANLPKRYAQWLQQGTARISISPVNPVSSSAA